jgi:hypothetical protein
MSRIHSHPAIVVLVAALVLSACGGSAKKVEKVDPAADLALAKTAVLTTADLPGYTANLFKKSTDISDSSKKQFAKCLNVGMTIFDANPAAQTVHSSAFVKDRASLSGSVEIYPKKTDVDQDWNEFTRPSSARCLQQLLQPSLVAAGPSGAVFGRTTVAKFHVGVGSRSIGYATMVTASLHGGHVTSYADFVFVTRDRAAIDLVAYSEGLPFTRSAEIALVRKIYDRIGSRAN